MATLYVLRHIDRLWNDGNAYEKTIGIYSTEERAQQAIDRLRDKPGFRDRPDRWDIEPVILDRDDAWFTGFLPRPSADDDKAENEK